VGGSGLGFLRGKWKNGFKKFRKRLTKIERLIKVDREKSVLDLF